MILGTFLDRPNRFVARVRLEDGRLVHVHVASSGRMTDLLVPGAPAAVLPAHTEQPGRKTAGLLAMVRAGDTWVSVDTSVPGKLRRAAFEAGTMPEFTGYTEVRPEVQYGESRIDFRLAAPGRAPCLVEVKSVTSCLVDPDGTRVARFPDAPTDRGARHLRELVHALGEGYRAAVCFVAQRSDVEAFGPYDQIDPAFGQALRQAAAAGVEVHVWRTLVSPEQIALGGKISVRF